MKVNSANNSSHKSVPTVKQKNKKGTSQNFATSDHGGVHIAKDGKYVGFVPTYNNCVTRFFANLFGWSYQVTLGGNTYHVERSKYLEFLNNNSEHDAEITSSNVWDFLDLSKVALKPSENAPLMRDQISASKAARLFKLMLHALVIENDVEKAKLFAGKGALIDTSYWLRENVEETFTTVDEGLPDDEAVDFAAARLTPLLFAADKGYVQFCQFLEQLKVDTAAKGEYVLFSKTTREEPNDTKVGDDYENVRSDGSLQTCFELKTFSTLNIDDLITTKFIITYNPETGKIERKESKQDSVKNHYTKPLECVTTQCLTG